MDFEALLILSGVFTLVALAVVLGYRRWKGRRR